ncbi:response regulator transcription factor [Luteolibacter marinus]|uniref:response regulator transcription factor n=1 Tax=Luteolibacter marinus TaxID=2776705 RepID=UPI001868F03F|nr:response regulator transcription factor [Luteolibacter marinus]
MNKILIVDDHPILRDGLESIIKRERGLAVCGKAGTVAEALELVERTDPDLVLTDLSLPGRNGLELIKDLRTLQPLLPVMVMSMHDELIYAERILRAGGRGYVMKEVPAEVLLQAIRRVLGGGVFVSDTVTNHFLGGMSGQAGGTPGFPIQRLTDRELEVFDLIGRGKGNQEIARLLSISPRTVDAHRTHIRDKLGLGDGNELIRYAVRWVESDVPR